MNESCCIYGWGVMSHIRMSHVTQMNESCHIYEWVTSYITYEWDMSHIWLIHMCDGLIHMYDMTHAYVSHDACTCMTWIGHMCPMTHSYVSHGSYIFVPWLIHTCDIQICKMNVRTRDIHTNKHTHTSAHARAHTQREMGTHTNRYAPTSVLALLV